MESLTYIYVYLDNRKKGVWEFSGITFNHQPFYVGKGKNGRIKNHLQPKNLNTNSIKNNIIRSIIEKTGELPIHYKIFENLQYEVANDIEIKMIKYFGRINLKNGILSNLTDGGEGFNNILFSNETKLKMSISAKGTKTYNNNGMSKIVEKYDLNGIFLERFSSLREAAESMDVSFKNISSCCRGQSNTAYGFIWKYVGKSYNPPLKKMENKIKRKKVYQYDLDGNFVGEYESMSEAEKITKIKHISCVCLGKLNFSGGYQWRYEKKDQISSLTFNDTKNIRRYKKQIITNPLKIYEKIN